MRQLTRRGILAIIVPTLKRTDQGGIDLRGGLGPQIATGADALKSRLISRFAIPRGAWPFNKSIGPRYNAIVGRFFDDTASAGILAAEVSGVKGAAPTPSTSVDFTEDPETRTLFAVIDPVIPTSGDTFAFTAEVG
jgi:hypothetical protein